MTIQPLSNRPREISVTEAIEPAYERMKMMLFKPFDLTKWMVIGFCAWLAGLGEAGGGFNTGNYGFNDHNGRQKEEFVSVYHKVSDYVLANLDWIIPLAGFAIVLILTIWLLLLWLNSRGKFMFLHCVAYNRAEVDLPWREYAREAMSLFWFRLVLGFMGMILMLPMVVVIAVNAFQLLLHGDPQISTIMLMVGLGLLCLLVSLVFAVIHKFLVDFVVPIMFLRRGTCLNAWREFGALLSANPGKFTVYLLFWIVLGMAIGALVLVAMVMTCCIAFCLLALPFIGTVIMLPILIFKRAFPLYYLAQYGPQYDVIPAAPPLAPVMTGFPPPPCAPQ